MSTENPVQQISAAQARELLPELEASGLPVAEFARQRNVDRVPPPFCRGYWDLSGTAIAG